MPGISADKPVALWSDTDSSRPSGVYYIEYLTIIRGRQYAMYDNIHAPTGGIDTRPAAGVEVVDRSGDAGERRRPATRGATRGGRRWR